MLHFIRRLEDRQVAAISKIADKIRGNAFYDRMRIADSISSHCQSFTLAELKSILRKINDGSRFNPNGAFKTKQHADEFISACNTLGISRFGYPLRDLILDEPRLLSSVLSVINSNDVNKFNVRRDPASAAIDGVYEVFLLNSRAKERTVTLTSPIERRILLVGRTKIVTNSASSSEQVVVEVLAKTNGTSNFARFGILIPDYPEFTALLSPFDLYKIMAGISQVPGGAISPLQEGGAQSLQFSVNDDGLTGSYQESSRSAGTFFASRLGDLTASIFRSAIGLLPGPRNYAPLESEKIGRNLQSSLNQP